jgi:hypothetical protein
VEQSEVESIEDKRSGREQGKVHDMGERMSEVEGRVQMIEVRSRDEHERNRRNSVEHKCDSTNKHTDRQTEIDTHIYRHTRIYMYRHTHIRM